MQVALDYYRILMLPIQADDRQIEQAYRDRLSLERPDRGIWLAYSSQALEARLQLLNQAAAVLLHGEERHAYDTQFTAANTGLDIPEELLAGALIILCETGDYRVALDLVEMLLQTPTALADQALLGDVILTGAIARQEMARESWQKGSYEEAAQGLQQALQGLQHYRAFPEMQAEINTDLGKLRPYRILQLLSTSEEGTAEREQGLILLRTMLDERGGIEGSGRDGSGLNTEDFLRFIQRLRLQMTAAEQQALFEGEAERPSMVAAFLAAQVLLTRGYTENRPALIRRARGYLVRLAQRQDVHLEHAICSLLLGQTEDAMQHLRLTQEKEPLSFIQEYSQGSPDQLPGLCRFIEKWFQDDVFPEFRQLDTAQISLQGYFDNPQVQAYLDEMQSSPAKDDLAIPTANRWAGMAPVLPRLESSPAAEIPSATTPSSAQVWFQADQMPAQPINGTAAYGSGDRVAALQNREQMGEPGLEETTGLLTPHSPMERSGSAARSRPPAPEDLQTHWDSPVAQRLPAATEVVPPRMSDLPNHAQAGYDDAGPYAAELGYTSANRPRSPRQRAARPPAVPAFVKPLVFFAIGVASLLIIWQMLKGLFTAPAPPDEQPQVQLDQPPVTIAASPATAPSPTTAVPPEWQGIQQVRVIASSGVKIRQEPNLQAAQVGLAASGNVLKISEVQTGTEGSVPIWLKIERSDGVTGWIAAEVNGSQLVQKQ